jgi:hypothetical protein
MVLRRTYATEAVEQAVVEGITRHGEDFVLVVESGTTGQDEDDRAVRFEDNAADDAPLGNGTRVAGPPR